jgi:hypothetical protein
MSLYNTIVELNCALTDRHGPLLVDLDDYDCIVAAHFSHDSKHEMGVVLRHSEGHIDLAVSPKFEQGVELEQWDDTVGSTLAGATPGLAILAALPGELSSRLGLRAVNMGGSAAVPMALFSGDARDLQEALIDYDLPYRLVMGLTASPTNDARVPYSKQLRGDSQTTLAPDDQHV